MSSASRDCPHFVHSHVSVILFFEISLSGISTRLFQQNLRDLRKLFLVECVVQTTIMSGVQDKGCLFPKMLFLSQGLYIHFFVLRTKPTFANLFTDQAKIPYLTGPSVFAPGMSPQCCNRLAAMINGRRKVLCSPKTACGYCSFVFTVCTGY